MEEGNSNRFNGEQARWHGLLWLMIVVLVCVGWAMLLSGCAAKKSFATDTTYVSDSSVRSTSSTVDSVLSETSSVKAIEKKYSEFIHDSVFVSQVIERETIIRQDSSGKELSRETNTTITNNRDRKRNVEQTSEGKETSQTNTDNHLVSKQQSQLDSVSSKSKFKSKTEQVTIQEQGNIWTRGKDFFQFLLNFICFVFHFLAICFTVCIVYYFFVTGYRIAKKKFLSMKSKAKGNDKEKDI